MIIPELDYSPYYLNGQYFFIFSLTILFASFTIVFFVFNRCFSCPGTCKLVFALP